MNRFITCLRIGRATLTDDAARQLGQVTAKSCVQKLYVDHITITPTSSPSSSHPLLALLPSLPSSPLQLLSLQSVGLSDADAAVLLSSLSSAPSLAVLNLAHNSLSHLSSSALHSALLTSTTLLHLTLTANPLTADDLGRVLAALLPGPVEAGEAKGNEGRDCGAGAAGEGGTGVEGGQRDAAGAGRVVVRGRAGDGGGGQEDEGGEGGRGAGEMWVGRTGWRC